MSLYLKSHLKDGMSIKSIKTNIVEIQEELNLPLKSDKAFQKFADNAIYGYSLINAISFT